ncbi:1-(5-phosphoribosyl)-5-[(5-phosphoribosylamino)methylideneamino] imidazole-4-carboxamide isomerase [Paramagnetospirillum caucaseum]|uniref:Imidazole glycerol phosphate synthase subunit HisF n=1 Tax=Paramagnetospirillum caucaseum TaxID=1244869 RepID=M2Z4L7_9PROT|nr:imidazole glycerol phosphate synthase cyclase subunit [Paramagnetospirillum caucaseum]EME69305.1 1-(5-phosphoribosyl)-5-[(5-phosphoribosylamino)methylideneamino] imidazole-4-carboxamide isomerase [Paramagnetospirillum caucaseum]
MTVRLIARLDIKAPNLVKGIQLEGLRVLGKPELFARHYSAEGIDELFYQDAVASLYERNSLLDIIERTSREIFIPLCVGGGLRSVDDIRVALQSGADKVSINTAAINRPEFIAEAANMFGSSTIVVAIEAIRQPDGRHLCFTDCGREFTGRDAITWAKQVAASGAGEILLTSVDRDGTGKGFDLELIAAIAAAVPIPVIAHGGAGTPAHVCEAVTTAGADAVAVASILHYHTIQVTDVGTSSSHAHYGHSARGVQPNSVDSLKQAMAAAHIPVRPAVTDHD